MENNAITANSGYPVSGPMVGTAGTPAAGLPGAKCATPRLLPSDHQPVMRSQAFIADVPSTPSAVDVKLRT